MESAARRARCYALPGRDSQPRRLTWTVLVSQTAAGCGAGSLLCRSPNGTQFVVADVYGEERVIADDDLCAIVAHNGHSVRLCRSRRNPNNSGLEHSQALQER